MTRRYAMLFKEKKPNEYTKGREARAYRDTPHKAQAGSAQAGPPGAPAGTRADGRPGRAGGLAGGQVTRGPSKTGQGQEEPHGKGSTAPCGHKDEDQQTQPRAMGGESDTGAAHELQLNLGSLIPPLLCLQLVLISGHLLLLPPLTPDGPACWASGALV